MERLRDVVKGARLRAVISGLNESGLVDLLYENRDYVPVADVHNMSLTEDQARLLKKRELIDRVRRMCLEVWPISRLSKE